MNKICVYAIAKNEAANVEGWVASMRPADHIIVLDTGSEDNTVELLSSLGVEVHQKQYNHFRFDIARNDSLDLIPEEYNIRVCTDLDERWESNNWADLLRAYWDENKPRIIYNYIWNHTDGKDGLQFHINKIHGKDPYLRWNGAVHEYLMDSRTKNKEFEEYLDMTQVLTLHHYSDFSKDRMFYLDLVKERAEEDGDDPQTWFLKGNEEKVKGHPEEAIKTYKYLIENFPDYSNWEISSAYYHLGQCYYQLGKGEEAMVAFSHGLAINKFYRDNYFGLGLLCYDNQMYDMAIGVIEEGLKTSQPCYGWMDDPFTWTFGLYDLLGLAYAAKGDMIKALGCATKALSYDSTNESLKQKYALYLSKISK